MTSMFPSSFISVILKCSNCTFLFYTSYFFPLPCFFDIRIITRNYRGIRNYGTIIFTTPQSSWVPEIQRLEHVRISKMVGKVSYSSSGYINSSNDPVFFKPFQNRVYFPCVIFSMWTFFQCFLIMLLSIQYSTPVLRDLTLNHLWVVDLFY